MASRGRPAIVVAALGIAAVVLGTAVACGHEDSSPPEASQTSQSTAAPTTPAAAAPGVELLEPGAEPREALRFALTEGAQFRATMTTQMGIGIEIDGEQIPTSPVPPMLADMTATVDQVAPNGDIDYTFALENFRVGDGAALPPEAQQSLDQLSGTTGQATMTATGEHTDSHLNIPPDLDPQMRSSLEGMSSQLTKITVPFPTEPVGIGARWRTQVSAELNGLHTDVTSTYTLRERNGDRYLIGISYEQSAPDQDAHLPGVPPEVSAHVDGMAVSGSGELEGSLLMVFPLNSTVHGAGTIDMRVDDGQSAQAMRQNLDINMSVQSIS